MAAQFRIHYLRRNEVDTARWDACLDRSSNAHIYAYHYYLDGICETWDALVLNDYEAVMPLPWKTKWGIRYLPYYPFCAALGIFGKAVDSSLLEAFLSAIPARFRYWDFPLNHGNCFSLDRFSLHRRINFVLPLHAAYPALQEGYRENVKRNIRKSVAMEYKVDRSFAVSEITALAMRFQPNNGISAGDYQRFERLFERLEAMGKAVTYGIRNKEAELLASCAFVFSGKRAYYLLVGNHPDGRTMGASHALIDAFIRDHAGSDLLLDFEGSDLRNLAFFYSSFGAHEEPYTAIRLNRLPIPLRWLKPH